MEPHFGDSEGETRLSIETSRTSERDHVGCIAARNGDRIDLGVFRHFADRSNGEEVLVQLTLDGDLPGTENWFTLRAERASL